MKKKQKLRVTIEFDLWVDGADRVVSLKEVTSGIKDAWGLYAGNDTLPVKGEWFPVPVRYGKMDLRVKEVN